MNIQNPLVTSPASRVLDAMPKANATTAAFRYLKTRHVELAEILDALHSFTVSQHSDPADDDSVGGAEMILEAASEFHAKCVDYHTLESRRARHQEASE